MNHLRYAGTLYGDIRNPWFTIRLFEKLHPYNIMFHIVGNMTEKEVALLPENVVYHGVVDSDTALAYMEAADVLVNIGNSIANQMPSKILTYISFGKPILNIIKLVDCPTLRYTNKYPLAMIVGEKDSIGSDDINNISSFLHSVKGNRIPYEKVEEIFYENTPGYVGDQIARVINDVTLPC